MLPKPAAPRKPRASKTTAPKKRKVSSPGHYLRVAGAMLIASTSPRFHAHAQDSSHAFAHDIREC